jgi:2-polyprenyl-3-methyl-5-hydroxy-6-metoxy-1,4-benzoquinol methylase
MKISNGLQENGIFIGNIYDKYGSNNLVARWIMNGFDNSLSRLISMVRPKTIHEVGCGEGYWVLHWNQQGIEARGTDFSEKIIDIARKNALNKGISPSRFNVRSVYEIKTDADAADLIVCCEVLEHLERPVEALKILQTVVSKYIIFSVPREPLWRVLNMLRLKYLNNFGNTPGHIQHWSARKFVSLVSAYFDIIEIRRPFPWTMVLCQVKENGVMYESYIKTMA